MLLRPTSHDSPHSIISSLPGGKYSGHRCLLHPGNPFFAPIPPLPLSSQRDTHFPHPSPTRHLRHTVTFSTGQADEARHIHTALAKLQSSRLRFLPRFLSGHYDFVSRTLSVTSPSSTLASPIFYLPSQHPKKTPLKSRMLSPLPTR